MLAPRLDEVLAQTDPFDLAQAAERHVRTLSGDRIRELIHDALPRMSAYYAREFSAVAAVENEDSLQHAFARSLKSNLRAIPLFGRPFGQAVLAQTPAEGAIGFGDQRAPRPARWMAAAVVACALLATIIGGVQYVISSRAQAASGTATPNAAFVPAAAPIRMARVARARKASPREHNIRPAPVAAAPAAAAPVASAPVRSPARMRPTPPPDAHGEAVVAVPRRPAKGRNPAWEDASLNTTDMPEPYTDATPLPLETTAAVAAPNGVKVTTPAPKRRGWLHRTLKHLDPFKPHP